MSVFRPRSPDFRFCAQHRIATTSPDGLENFRASFVVLGRQSVGVHRRLGGCTSVGDLGTPADVGGAMKAAGRKLPVLVLSRFDNCDVLCTRIFLFYCFWNVKKRVVNYIFHMGTTFFYYLVISKKQMGQQVSSYMRSEETCESASGTRMSDEVCS